MILGPDREAIERRAPPPPSPPPPPKANANPHPFQNTMQQAAAPQSGAPSTSATGKQVDAAQSAITTGANAYQPTAPTVTLDDSITRALKPVVDQAQQDLTKDQASADNTQAELNGIYDNMDRSGPRGGQLHAAQTLEQRLAEQNQQVNADKATVAAGNVALFRQQRQADQTTACASSQTAVKSYQHMAKALPSGVTLKQGDVLNADQIAKLNPQQRSTYDAYVGAQTRAANDHAKVNADTAAINQNYAQLQLFASDPGKYGTVARDAVNKVNQALGPLKPPVQMPQGIDAKTAQLNLDNANQAATHDNAVWNATTASVAALNKASASGNGSPESAQNGTEAANDLLSSNNPYFYNRLLFKTDPGYSPETAKAQAFAATLSDYEQKGDHAGIARFLNTLGPSQAANLFADAGTLQGPQYNASGAVFAKDQAGVDQVLGKALVAPGVQLGDGTQPGTLANSLLQQATQSGSSALSVAGILNGSGTSTQAEALKNKFLNEIVVNGKALGNSTTNSAAAHFDRANYAQAALTVINGDPTSLDQYQGKLAEQHGLLATYQQLQQNANPGDGIFGSNGANVPTAERGFLKGLSREIDANLYGIGGQSNKGPATGVIDPNTQYDIQQYLAGKVSNGNESPSQRLANMMSVLGPSRAYAVLGNMTPAQAQQFGIQSSLNTLTDNLQFTAGDAKNLALAQANFATSQSQYDFPGIGSVGSFMNSLPNDQNGAAVKVGYAQGCIAGAQQLAQEIGSGKYSGQVQNQLTATLNGLCENATSLSAGFSDPVKEQLFSQLHTAATQLAGTGAAKQSDVLNAYAANILGSLSDRSQIAANLRAMGGVGADGAIDPNSNLAKFLRSALSGQSQLGIASYFGNNMTPNGQMPQGVTSLLKGISGSGDTKLMAGTLDTVMQWTINNPTQAEVLASQDTGSGATGYRDALTSMLDRSFNQFVALDPSNPSSTLVRTMQPQAISDLQVLSAVEMGPPYDSKIAGNFAQVFGTHAVQFAAYAGDQAKYPQLDSLLAGGGDPRNSAAVIFGQLMNGFDAGLNQSQASFQAQAHDAKAAADQTLLEARVITDLLRGLGTGTLLASAWITGGATVSIGLGAVANGEKLASIFGRVGLFSGSVGTAVLDAFFSNTAAQNQAQAEEHAVQEVEQGMQTADVKPTQLLQQIYNGWFSSISQLPGAEGQTITDGVMTGSSFAEAPTIETDVQNFYGAYNPMGYYQSQTGQYPSVS